MAKTRPQTPKDEPTQVPADDQSRQAFLDELEGHVPVAEVKLSGKRRVRIQAELEDVAEPQPKVADESLAAVLPDAPKAGKPIESTTFDQAKRRNPWMVVIPILVVFAAVAVAGFMFFSRGTKFDGQNVGLAIDAPTQLASGDTVTLTIRYHNNETVDLKNAQLSMLYPDGFTVTAASKTATDNFKNSFTIGTIHSGEVGEITVTGGLVGSVGATEAFSGTLSYEPANFNSNFQAKAAAQLMISSSIVALTVDGPKSMSPNAVATWTISYTNSSAQDLSNLELDATIPDGLSVTATDPKPTSGTNQWRLSMIKAGAKGTIKITAKATGSVGDSLELAASLGLVQTGGTTIPQAQTTFLTALVQTGLTVAVAANGATDSSAIKPGDTITYSINIANNHATEITNVSVAATLNGALLDIANRQDPAKGTLTGQTITWTKSQVQGLASVKPNDSLIITFTIPTIAPLPAKADGDRNPQGSISVAVTSPDLSTTGTAPTVLITKVQTIVGFTTEARYYTDAGAALGTGPIPPKVGATTTYRVTWKATTTTNDVNTFTASTVLPTNVLWTGRNVGRDAGDINFDPASRTVTWSINKIPGGTGSRYPTLTATFEVSVTPTADQVGSLIVLTEASTANGIDGSTNQKLSVTATSLSSDVPNDPHAGGEGAVVS